MKKFNINEYMYIQINKNGWEYLEKTVGLKYIESCIKSREVKIENELWYRLQCHNVIELFPMNIGGIPYYNTNVMFDDQAITQYQH